jgi:hypothetical protein
MSAEATGSHRPYETDDRMVRLTPAAEPEAQELESSNTRSTVRPTRGKPRKMFVYKKNKSTIHLHVIPIMKCGCVFWEFAKRKLAIRKDKIR